MWATFNQSQDPLNYARFASCRSELRKLTKKLRRDFEQQLAADIKSTSKVLWRYANSRQRTSCRIVDLATPDGDQVNYNF